LAEPNAPPLPIRTAGPADAAELARLRYEFRAGLGQDPEPEAAFLARCTPWMAKRLGSAGAWRCYVAEGGGGICGMIWLQLLEKLPNPVAEPERHGYITSFYVRPAQRGSGLGSRLMEACLRECQAQSLDAVILWPTPRSRTLYRRYGFEVREDLMERRLSHG
jgi:ribosomal protein S18 acetylase RimI-like enzyme